ncbi:hypothetical protein LCGC14_1726360 [marine sediment metagenome]|uniref:Uncharacterized protein n=1 Tax=marine sediment metagenome TaxID=412755 RepID=A0A0F9JRG7_9ZZZZ
MGAVLTEVLLGLFAIGALLLHLQHSAEIRQLRKDLKELLDEVDNNSARVASFGKFIRVCEEVQKRNGKTA